MTSERLTRQELTWLLTQEARSAAEKLRRGVATMATTEIRGQTIPAPVGLESELEALDDAMKMLATLHAGSTPRGRRGRVDLAALLCEVAPSTKVSLEPGAGTEVFGDESELRRMLQVLVGSTTPSGAPAETGTREVAIRREGSDVRVSVGLGPDSSANLGTERAWLSRMAIRYGGRIELEGATESLLLPADGSTEASEMEALRKELEAAQRQGEAYARELAAVYSSPSPEQPAASPSIPPEASVTLSALSGLAAAVGAELRDIARSVLDGAESGDSVRRTIAPAAALAADLEALARCPIHETKGIVDVAALARTVTTELAPRAEERRVRTRVAGVDGVQIQTRLAAARLLLSLLIADAILASSADGEVTVSVEGHSVIIEDAGPGLGAESFALLLQGQLTPRDVGRPNTPALYCAGALAVHASAQVAADAGPRGRIVVRFAPAR